MSYHQHFDRLGNQVPPPKPDWQHRTIQVCAWAVVIVCVLLMAPGGR